MTVESANYINALDPNLPSATDGLVEADDHIRTIKRCIKNTFPNLDAPVTLTSAQLNSAIPIGGIMMWSGAVNTIPTGWHLCDGTTVARSDAAGNIVCPDLRDRFVIGAGNTLAPGAIGGSVALSVNTAAGGSHTHAAWTDIQGVHAHGGATAGHALTGTENGPHTHTYSAAHVDQPSSGIGLYYQSGAVVFEGSGETGASGAGAPHAHGITADGAHGHNIGVAVDPGHAHTVNIPDHRPPYYALCMIIKV